MMQPSGRAIRGTGFLGIVVVNFGAHRIIEENLGSLALGTDDARVVIVDNFQSTPERRAIERLTDERGWTLVPVDRNLGFGSGMNLGVAAAKALGCDTFALVNPDVKISVDVLSALDAGCREQRMTLFSPRINWPDGRLWFGGGQIHTAAGRTTTREDLVQTGPDRWLTGACLALSHTLWEAVGGFDEDYFLYWEDIDLSVRCLNVGGDLLVRHDLTVVHSVGGTQPKAPKSIGGKSRIYYRYNCRNRLVFASKHLPPKLRLRWAVQSPVYAKAVLLRGGKRQFRRPFGPLWAATEGTAAGLWALARAGLRPPSGTVERPAGPLRTATSSISCSGERQ